MIELSVARRVEQHPIVYPIAAAVLPPDLVVEVPPRRRGDPCVAMRAAHGGTLRHGDASVRGMDGQETQRTPLIDLCWMVCRYPRAGRVSSEKHQGMPALRGRSEVGYLGHGDRNGSDGRLLDSDRGAYGQQPIG
jgi:hypothetical protein